MLKISASPPPQPRITRPGGPHRVAAVTATIHPDAFIRLSQILGTGGNPPLIACGKTAFYNWVKAGKLPPPRKVGRASFWRAGDILDALENLR